MVETLEFKKNNYGFVVTFTVREHDGTVKDLTGITPTFKLINVSGGTVVSRTCTVTDATGGVCTVVIGEGDFSTSGTYNAEVELTDTGYLEDTVSFIVKILDTVS